MLQHMQTLNKMLKSDSSAFSVAVSSVKDEDVRCPKCKSTLFKNLQFFDDGEVVCGCMECKSRFFYNVRD
jgi:hypothetical protein